MKEYFFLFGTAAVKAYNEGEAKQVLEGYESGELYYGTYKWDDKSTPRQLRIAIKRKPTCFNRGVNFH